MNERITVEATISADLDQVWDYFNQPQHVTQWNFAHESWQCPASQNNLQVGGSFNHRMEARDGSFGFDFEGYYDEIIPKELIKYHLSDGRKIEVQFSQSDDQTVHVSETFDPETENTLELQREGWQAILNNFKSYVENNK